MWVSVFILAICAWRADTASAGVSPDGQLFRRDYTFDQISGGWLKFYPMPVKWEEAVLRCHHEGAILASPLNEKVSGALSTVMGDHGLTTVPIFTGISNTYASSEYQSMEGIPITDMCLVWSAEPNVQISNHICIAMYANGTATAVSCADRHPFICYRQKGVNELNKCGTADPEYVFYSATGSCYKKYTTALNWSGAFRRCAIDGAHLAVINSEAEAEILWQLRGSNTVLIGARAWGEKREWITVQGQSLEEAGYSKWHKDEPNNNGGSENCASIYVGELKGGVMNDVSCNNVDNFFCEIEAKVGELEAKPFWR